MRGVSGAPRRRKILIAAARLVIVALLSSFLVVALAEMGDKTQLVALSMASRYRRPWAVLLGILIATTVNHALASSVGVWAATRMPAAVVQ
jgi:putative Ca2+/H+ antiporter (TMEM165/GDT1 family)